MDSILTASVSRPICLSEKGNIHERCRNEPQSCQSQPAVARMGPDWPSRGCWPGMDRANEVVRRPRAATIRESERIVVEWRRSGESSTGMEQLTDNPNVPKFGGHKQSYNCRPYYISSTALRRHDCGEHHPFLLPTIMQSSKPRDYCCCAIPLVNAGIYATLIEQTAAGLLIGTLSIATPESMRIHHLNEAPVTNLYHSHSCWRLYLLGCEVDPRNLSLCYYWRTTLGFHWCLKGKFSPTVLVPLSHDSSIQENPSLYRRYVTLHGLCAPIAFSVAAAWIIMSATRHSTAKAQCLLNFFSDASGASSSEGDTLCNIFPWVDVGIMGGLWVILAALHVCNPFSCYFCSVVSPVDRRLPDISLCCHCVLRKLTTPRPRSLQPGLRSHSTHHGKCPPQ